MWLCMLWNRPELIIMYVKLCIHCAISVYKTWINLYAILSLCFTCNTRPFHLGYLRLSIKLSFLLSLGVHTCCEAATRTPDTLAEVLM